MLMEAWIYLTNCFAEINLTHLDWKKSYTIRCRIGLRIFSFIFPSVLKINFKI